MENYKKRKYNDIDNIFNKKYKLNNKLQDNIDNNYLQNEIIDLKKLINILMQQINYQNNKLNKIEEKIDDNKSILNLNQTTNMLEKNNISSQNISSVENESSCNYIS